MTSLPVDADDPPDLTDTLQQGSKRLAGSGSFGTVYRCLCAQNGEVAVKAISFPASISRAERDEFLRKMRRELGIWKRLDHPNIVPLLGIALGDDFGSDHHCMVSMWMPHGTLADYVTRPENELSLPSRIRLITGSVAGLEYLHSLSIVHGDFHPGNIMIDKDRNPRLTDFGFSQTHQPQENLTYLWTGTIRPGAAMWVAPELRHPELFWDLMIDVKDETRLASDIYSLGSIILFTLSGKSPWTTEEFARRSGELQNPPRPPWPVIPDLVWNFIEQCWSPRDPQSRPLAREVLSFCRDRLQNLLQPNPGADINVILFGAVGCGKSSIINLLAEEGLAPVSTNKEPCTTRPRCYPVPIGQKQFRLWDTTGFRLSQQSGTSYLPPYEQAHSVLQNLRDGIHLVLLCARKDEISLSLRSLYWLINDFFFGGHAPVALVVTHFDTPDKWWWSGNQRFIMGETGIPTQSIEHVCITTGPSARDESRQMLRALLTNCSNVAAPIPLRLDLSPLNTAFRNIASHCHLSNYDATVLVEKFKFNRIPNIVVYGEPGAGKSSTINLIAGEKLAPTSNDVPERAFQYQHYVIPIGGASYTFWDTTGQDEVTEETVPTSNLRMFMQELARSNGVDLVIYCISSGQRAAAAQKNYRRLYAAISPKKVPVALVVTGLEHQAGEMEAWWDTNAASLGQNKMEFSAHACVTTVDVADRAIQERRLHSQEILRELVIWYRELPPWKTDSSFLSKISRSTRIAMRRRTMVGYT